MRALATNETARLAVLEKTIDGGLRTFLDVGLALKEIRDLRLYRAGHETFDDYCRRRWGLSGSYAHRTIQAAGVVAELPIGESPTNEAQARELLPLQDKPDRMARAWRGAVERAQKEDRRVTAADVRIEVASRRPGTAKTPTATPRSVSPKPAPPLSEPRTPGPAASRSHQAERIEASCRLIREWADEVDVESDPGRWLPQLLAAQAALEALVDRARLAGDSSLSESGLAKAKAMAERLGVQLV
jgi:cell division septation protein DedD